MGNILATALYEPQQKDCHTCAISKSVCVCMCVRVCAYEAGLENKAGSRILINFINARSGATTMRDTMRCDVSAPRIML